MDLKPLRLPAAATRISIAGVAGFLALDLACAAPSAAAEETPARFEATGGLRADLSSSRLSGAAAAETLQTVESVQASALDLSLRYHPSERIAARADLRFHQDWRALPAGRGGVAALRRLSVDGAFGSGAGAGFAFSAGDFRRRLTPLTLWTPAPDLVEEPELLARRREGLMGERLLAVPDRNLQGAALSWSRGFGSRLPSLSLDLLGARLARAEFLDPDGAQGLGLARADMDRLLVGGGAEALLWGRLTLGAGALRTADDRSTYETFPLSPELRRAVLGDSPDPGTSLNGRDSVPARTLSVTHGRARLDLAGLLSLERWTLEAGAEAAASDVSRLPAWGWRVDSAGGTPVSVPVAAPAVRARDRAVALEASAGWRDTASGTGFRFAGRRLDNGPRFLNPLAQTPAFAPARILNVENDPDGSLYTAFDALYQGVYLAAPSRRAPGRHRAPHQKNAYVGGTWSPEDLAAFRPDPLVQLELPFGPATPNRVGWTARLEASWRGALHATLASARLKEKTAPAAASGVFDGAGLPLPGAGPAAYSLDAAGLRLDLHRLASFLPPFTVNAGLAARAATPPAGDPRGGKTASGLRMAGFRLQAARRWTLLGAWQAARVESPLAGAAGGVRVETLAHWRGGLEYAVTPAAHLHLGAGRISRDQAATAPGSPGSVPAFAQTQVQAVVNAGF